MQARLGVLLALFLVPFTWAADLNDPALRDRFNALIDGVSIVELPADYSTSDAGTAARLLVRHLRSVLSGTAAES
jgi:hypothetical protein